MASTRSLGSSPRSACRIAAFVLGCLLLALPAQVRGAAFFTEDFNGDVALDGTKWVQLSTSSYVAPVFTGTTMNLQNDVNNRQFFRTVDSDYSTVDYVAEVTLTTRNDANNNTNRTWFLMHGGALGGFGDPNINPTIGLFFGVAGTTTYDNGTALVNFSDPVGPTRVRLTWTAATKQMVAQADFNYNGTFAADATYNLDGSNNGFNATNSYLTFGGSGFLGAQSGVPGLVIDDFSLQGSGGKFATATGDWSNAASWASGSEPAAADDASIGGGYTISVTQAGEVAQNLKVGHSGSTAPGAGTLNISGGALSIGTQLSIGSPSFSGVVNLSAGTLSVLGNTTIVDSPVGPTFGTFNITGGSYTEAGDLIVGQTATGIVNQSGGTANIGITAGDLEIGVPGGSTGTVNLSGGTMTVQNGNVIVGGAGSGALNVSGGTLDVTDGTISAGTGDILTLSGGVIRDADSISMQAGTGIFSQTGGTLEVGPGPAAGQADVTAIIGGFTLTSGTVAIDIFSPTQIDLLTVEDTATLNGTVSLSFGFAPLPTQSFNVLTANTITIQPGFGVAGGYYRVLGTAGAGQILQVYAPEPGAIAIWAMLALAAGISVRRFAKR